MAYHGAMADEPAYERTTDDAEATRRFAATLTPHLEAGDVIVLSGDLGAGKTRFVQGIARSLGAPADATSPTFNILHEYRGGRLPVYHFDLYRLDDAAQLDDLAYFETLEGDGVSCVEWGGKFPEALPCDYLEVSLSAGAGGSRNVRARACGEAARELLSRWAKDPASRLARAV